MEPYLSKREYALQQIKIADHLLLHSYPLLKDPKLLLAVVKHLYACLQASVESLLLYEYLFKRIRSLSEKPAEKLDLFQKVCKRYHLREDHPKLFMEVNSIIEAHKNAPVEFSRKDCFVICSEKYKIRTISLEQIKSLLSRTQIFFKDLHYITEKHERIFR